MAIDTLTVEFIDCTEVRMGSPYDCCTIKLEGSWIPQLPIGDWQNVSASSPDGRFLGLVRWSTAENQPGFYVFTIDLNARSVRKSSRIKGCCESLWWDGARFKWRAFRLAEVEKRSPRQRASTSLVRPIPPFVIIRDGRSFWVELRDVAHWSATLQAFRDGCYRGAWCYDSSGVGWHILNATLKQPRSLANRLRPWKMLPVEVRLGLWKEIGVARVISELAAILGSGNDFCESLRTSPAELLAQFRNARTPEAIIEVARTVR